MDILSLLDILRRDMSSYWFDVPRDICVLCVHARPYKFLDFFEYENVEIYNQNKIFNNCKILKELREGDSIYVQGDIVSSISLSITFYFWGNNDIDNDEITVNI